MRWFTDDAHADDRDWDRQVAAYSAHLAEIAPSLPADLAALATDERLDLHDGRIREIAIGLHSEGVTMVVDRVAGAGVRRITARFAEARIVPDDYALLAEAIGAEFRANHWHQRRTVSTILSHEIDLLPDGRFVLRVRLWPFHEFAIEFAALTLDASLAASQGPERAGRLVIRGAD